MAPEKDPKKRLGHQSSASAKSINAFVASKNSLNRSHRGSWREINEDVFYTAFHIYLDAIKYDPQEGFGCPKCPIELGKDEKESNFPDEIEVHISDGIVIRVSQNLKNITQKG